MEPNYDKYLRRCEDDFMSGYAQGFEDDSLSPEEQAEEFDREQEERGGEYDAEDCW